jgi:prevent-host-death family protein
MIAVNMHEAKSRLSALVKAVEEDGETVILCRNGKEVAEIRPYVRPKNPGRDLTPDPALRPILAAGFDPAEPLTEEEWPEDCR